MLFKRQLRKRIKQSVLDYDVVPNGTGSHCHGVYNIGDNTVAKVYRDGHKWRTEWRNMLLLHEQGVSIPQPYEHIRLRRTSYSPRFANTMERIDGTLLCDINDIDDKAEYRTRMNEELEKAKKYGWHVGCDARLGQNVIVVSKRVVLLDFVDWEYQEGL